MGIPFANKRVQPRGEMLFVFEIGNAESLALEDTEPLFDLIHPGAMNWRMMEMEAGMLSEPCLHLLALVHLQVIEHDVNRLDGRIDFPLQFVQ